MMNKLLSGFLLALWCLAALTCTAVRAEEDDDVEFVDPPEQTEPAEDVPPSAAEELARVPVDIDTEALAAAISEALATPEPDPETAPAPEPTPQVIVIQSTPETAAPEATPEPTIWVKPFSDYSTVEGLLLVIFVALCFLLLLVWLR